MSIHSSYVDEAQAAADNLVAAINDQLRKHGIPPYQDPDEPPAVYRGNKFGRSSLDHHSAACLVGVAEFDAALVHLGLVARNPYRLVFLPFDFSQPFETRHVERIFDEEHSVWAGSTQRLLADLRALGPRLGIKLDGDLSDELAGRIDDRGYRHRLQGIAGKGNSGRGAPAETC